MPPEQGPVAENLTVNCKVNLFLRITGRLDNGYHTLESLFWPLSAPHDTLTVTRTKDGKLTFSCGDPALEGPDNLVVRAYAAFAAATGFSPGIAVHLQKNIPYGAGLGGGSADAAALLGYLNARAEKEGEKSLDPVALTRLGAKLGADVPFFFANRPCHVRGIGDRITPLQREEISRFANLHLVLICPKIRVATTWAFTAWDQKVPAETLTNEGEKDTSPLVRGLRVCNDLRRIVFERYPELGQTLGQLRAFGAEAASMSGSGASLFGLYSSSSQAKNAVRFFQERGELVFHHVL